MSSGILPATIMVEVVIMSATTFAEWLQLVDYNLHKDN